MRKSSVSVLYSFPLVNSLPQNLLPQGQERDSLLVGGGKLIVGRVKCTDDINF